MKWRGFLQAERLQFYGIDRFDLHQAGTKFAIQTVTVTFCSPQTNGRSARERNMKAISLLLLRVATGLLLLIWGIVRLGAPEMGAHVSNKYYGGLGQTATIQMIWGAALVVIGLLCIAGLWRRFSYVAQAIILVTGALSIWKYLLDPLGLYLLTRETSQILFFPSLGMAAATLVLLAFRDEDSLSLDARFGWH